MQNDDGFPTTRWSELAAIRGGRTDEKAAALSELATRYRRPVLAFLLMRVRDPAKAEDLLQGFLAHSLEKNFFAKASEQRGRFRNFLLSSLKNYLISEHRREAAAMRAPEGGFVAGSPDQPVPEPVDSVTPESVFEVAWIHDIIIKALDRYRDECSDANRDNYYQVLSAYVVEPCLDGTERPSLQSIADGRGISRKQAEHQLDIALKELRRLLLEEVHVYSSGEEDTAMEIRDLFRTLGGPAPKL
jgi:RNA polymerase sigma-70 factor (ECF subfamily)